FTIRQFKKDNPEGAIYVFCHKVDLLEPDQMVIVFNHIKEMFDDPRFNIHFENTSIYFPESLREFVFTIMRENKVKMGCYELISNAGEKIEQSVDFERFIIKEKDETKVQQVMDLFLPEPEQELPTISRKEIVFDFTEEDFIELILYNHIDISPVTGVNFLSTVSIEKSMEYILALHEFKKIIEERKGEIYPKGTIFISSDGHVHGLAFRLKYYYLVITAFTEFSEHKRTTLYEMLFQFTNAKEEIIDLQDDKLEDFAYILIRNRGRLSQI
ncbi:MAG: hypothetical protein ACXABK_04930, partial [Candidatus Heimdallarchaeaceae archaeon]